MKWSFFGTEFAISSAPISIERATDMIPSDGHPEDRAALMPFLGREGIYCEGPYTQIPDWGFMIGIVCERIRRELKRNKSANAIVRSPKPLGVAYYTAMLAIDRFFHSLTNDEPEPIYSYDTIEMLNDIMEAWEKVDRDNRLSARFGEAVGILSYKFDHAKLDDQVAMLIDDVGPMLRKLAASCLKDQSYPKIRHLYGLEIADRLLHDRQICGYIASQLTSLSRWSGRRRRTTFVRRTKWPAFVKPLIVARDRGKCAICKTDITGELLAKAHIDHIEPLAAGGCNDVVNLQLCCEMCNLTKGAGAADVANSIPRYHQRRRLQSKPDDLRRSAFATAKRAGYF